MAIAVEVTLPGVSTEQYDRVRRETRWLETIPAGGHAHITWWEGEDCHSVDAWQDETALQEFLDKRLAPAMAAAGVTTEPRITVHPAHEVFTVGRATVVATDAGELADPVATMRRGYQAFAQGDIAAVLSLFDPDIVWTAPEVLPTGGTYRGAQGVGEFFGTLATHFAELSVVPEEFLADGDQVVVRCMTTGRTAAGNSFAEPSIHCWTLRDGRPVRFEEFTDTATMAVAMGIPVQATSVDLTSPAPARA